MSEEPGHPPTREISTTTRPRRAPIPLQPFLLATSIATASILFALLFLPLFAGVGAGVKLVEDRLSLESEDFKRIPRFPERSIVLANDGTVLFRFIGDENRAIVRLKRVSNAARKAVLAIEDDGFYEHGALDLEAVVRATLANLAAGQVVQGGSTLTQQLVKNAVIGDPARTFERKFRELALATQVEQTYTKDEILELYVNQVYLGNGVYGIGTAAQFYYDKPAEDLTLPEGAMIAGLISSPETYDPLDHPKRARRRRNEVLTRLDVLDWISHERINEAKAAPLGLPKTAGQQRKPVEPFFVYYLRELILENESKEFNEFGRTYDQRVYTLYQGGLRIYTTLDPEWQRIAEQAIRHGLPQEGPDGSLVSVETRSGAIRAMVSGKDYENDRVNLAWGGGPSPGLRQTGSAFKPFTLVAALEQGIPPTRVYSSAPFCGNGWEKAPGVPACVDNAEPGSKGNMDLWSATAGSVNAVFARLVLDVGPANVVDAANRMGISATLDAVPSITLGVEEVSTLDMASAFGTLANDGKYCEPFAIVRVDAPAGILYKHKVDCEQAIEPDIAHLVTAMLENVLKPGGTAGDDGLGDRPAAGKTGTSQTYTNLYFTGYTRQVSTAVWVGHPSGQIALDRWFGSPFGGSVAAPIWQEFMLKVTADMPRVEFPGPPEPERGQVPDVVGLEVSVAKQRIAKAHFFPLVNMVDSFEPAGIVISQSPSAGSQAALGEYVTIQVSTGKPPTITVPEVRGLTQKEATALLKQKGFEVAVLVRTFTDPKKDGIVVAQSPKPGNQVTEGATVTITVGKLKEEEPPPTP